MAYIGNTSTTQAFTPAVDYFSGNGSTVAFTLSRPVASVAQVQVNVNNVQQNPGSAYTVSGNTITFTGAPSSGTNNIYVYYTSPITQVISPGQNTVYPSSLSYTNALYWDTSGNVGIGTSSPSGKLDVVGSTASAVQQLIKNSNGATNSSAELTFGTWSGSSASAPQAKVAAINVNSGNAATDLAFSTYTGASLAERMRIDSSGNVGIGTSSPATKLDVSGPASVTSFTGTTKLGVVTRGSSGATDYSGVDFIGGNQVNPVARIAALTTGGGSTLSFGTSNNYASGITNTAMTIDQSGNLLVSKTADTDSVAGTVITLVDAGGAGKHGKIKVTNTVGTGQYILQGLNASGSTVGGVTTTSTNTSFPTSSDYRLKENIAPMTGALDKVAQLKPCTYTWKLNGETTQGFIAHELQAIVPECVVGEKDAVETYTDEDGNEQTRPVYQGIDTSFLVATLTAAIQEQQALITTLTERITALEAK